MTTKKYELVFIVSPENTEKEAASAAQKIKDSIKKSGGTLTFEDFWGKRDFAYKIAKFSNGYYFLCEFEFNPLKIEEFEKELLIDKNVLRHLITLVPLDYIQKEYGVIQSEGEELIKAKKAKETVEAPKKEPIQKIIKKPAVVKAEVEDDDDAEFDKAKLDKVLSDF